MLRHFWMVSTLASCMGQRLVSFHGILECKTVLTEHHYLSLLGPGLSISSNLGRLFLRGVVGSGGRLVLVEGLGRALRTGGVGDVGSGGRLRILSGV